MKHWSVTLSLAVILFGVTCNNNQSQSGSTAGGIRVVRSGLQHAWEITWGPDNHIWLTERDGKVSRIDPANGNTSFSFTIPDVISRGEGGLLGMALHPEFLKNGLLYVVYNYHNDGDYREKLVRYTYGNNTLSNPTILFDNIRAAGIHNGSRIWITHEANPKIFLTTGDASHQDLPQQTKTVNGKVLRLNIDGTIPADNPFPGNPVWSYGHRNPQGLVMANNILYEAEHGASTEDEVNIIEKARNYGWPDVEGPCNEGNEIDFCNRHRVVAPIWSSGGNTIAVCGLDYYNHDRIPEWKNSLLMVTLKNSSLRQLKLSADGRSVSSIKTYFKNDWGRLRDVCVSPDGRVFISTSNGSDDKIIEITNPKE
jgi:glucose/arabinose dehydrogenase